MAIAPTEPRPRPARVVEHPAVLTARGAAVALLICLERLWPTLSAADRAYVAPTLAELARQAGEGRVAR